MTRATESLTNLLPTERAEHLQEQVSERVETALAHVEDSAVRVKESEAVDQALRCARSAALAAARGAGQVSVFLGRQGASLAKKGYERARTVPVKEVTQDVIRPLTSAVAPVEEKKSRKGRRIAIVVLVGAAVAGGAVFFKSRRREQPRVASAPPNLRDLDSADAQEATPPTATKPLTAN
ncbi:hypothetical protein [Rhodococcus sp. NCIMB 12038]|uniref:hypothetical protein n=1 Tax=Rhodococcus sp. NCIMB 12038 TaxID=933800 RepID=UPI000B3C5ED7|nr:hypothetical protein [Rhodococcus sp. NCIMB 12038]OUS97514.1 hypothetical protein CA951_00320 [Rhodococcus sp. NCIMB 12038]